MTHDSKDSPPTVFIAASGSGGHLLPARLIADVLRDKYQIHSQFIGSGRPLEESIIGKKGYSIHVLKTVGLAKRGIRGVLEFLITLPKAFFKMVGLHRKYRPKVIIGVGGYVSFLPAVVGKLFGAKLWLHEAEDEFGIANRVLSVIADRISTCTPGTSASSHPKAIVTGQPVHPDILKVLSQRKNVFPPKKILILGGSQGASSLDSVMKELASEFLKRGIKIWHQCRKENVEELEDVYKRASVEAKVQDFIEDMPTALLWADLVVSRSGRGATTELGVIQVPTIYVPLPTSAKNHQYVNAERACQVSPAVLVEEGEEFARRVLEAIDGFSSDRMLETSGSMSERNFVSAEELIAKEVVEMTVE